MPSINMPTKQSAPMMIASVNWPLTKFVKVWFVSDAMFNSRCALRHGSTDFSVFLRIMKEIYNFRQKLLGFILTGNI
jgi:hypothetical protein